MKLFRVVGLIGILSLLLFTGCGMYTNFGSIYTDISLPRHIDSDLAKEYSLHPDRFEVLGEVEGSASNVNVLGLVAIGKGGYISAVSDAKGKAGADGLVNVIADVKVVGFLGLFTEYKTVVRGKAVKRK
jgi:hypothetical protein